MNCKLYLFITLFLWGMAGKGQSFKWHAVLEEVPVSGFYNIALTPELVSKTDDPGLADIRIFEKNKEIAWLLRKGTDSTDTAGTLNLKHYSSVPVASVKTQEIKTSKQSMVTVLLHKAYQVDKLKLTVEGFRFYRREAWLAEPNPDFKHKKNRDPYHRLFSFIILSGKPTIIDLPGESRYKQLQLIIANEDNAALTIKKVEAYQKNMHLTAYLEKDKRYTIKTGQANMNPPRYDLDYFNDSIGKGLSFVKVGNFSRNNTEVKQGKSFFVSKSWIWSALAVLIVFIGYLSYRMVNDMQRKKAE
ncbi:hypothetical protein [Pedobacter heparinus]|uniref:hypothetical protein n=1 Tax=Pedobacter heparinus TaxID=984 RepID=UPI00292CD3E1|nr:hypothetical protein [Pedobacter heparinus]